MDERVYTVEVCASCLTQTTKATGTCPACGVEETKTVRFRCSRDRVLAQADPHRSLVERTLYFGCVREAGHYYWTRTRHGEPVKAPGGRMKDQGRTPWGYEVDGGLFPKNHGPERLYEAHTFHRDDWTALAFLDRSVDTRGGSWSVYCIPAILDGPEALAVAREAYPTIFARYPQPVTFADA